MQNSKVKIQNFLILTLLVSLFFSAVPDTALADGFCQGPIVPCGRTGTPPCQFCHIFTLLNNLINLVLTCFAPIIAVLMLILGGLMFMISHFSEAEMLPGGTKGGPKLFSQAKGAITAVVIGLVIIFVAWVFLNTLFTYMDVAEWTGFLDNPNTPEKEGWWKINCP